MEPRVSGLPVPRWGLPGRRSCSAQPPQPSWEPFVCLFFLVPWLLAPDQPFRQVASYSLLMTVSFYPQEFFSVAWTALTVVTQAGHKKRWNMLAAAGLRGMVRLLHVRAGFCCSVIRAHKKAIATLCFSPTHETHLFSKTLASGLSQQPFQPWWPLGLLWGGRAQDPGPRQRYSEVR